MVIVDNGRVVEDGPRDAVLSRIKVKAEKIRAMSIATSPSTS
jgi:hypothetical protein